MTNFEKIKSMSKEQMTHFMLDIMLDTLNNNVCGYCENCDAPCLGNEEIIRKELNKINVYDENLQVDNNALIMYPLKDI